MGILLWAPQLASLRPCSHRSVAAMHPRPHLRAVRDCPMYLDCGARARQGWCPLTCARSSPGCVCVGGESAPKPPTMPPTLPPLCVPAMRPRPRTHAFRHSPMYLDCGARAEQGWYLPACAHYSPWWGLCCRPPPSHPHTLPPWRVPAMHSRPYTHAVPHSPIYVHCGARAGNGCYLSTCAHYSPGCVGVVGTRPP